MNTFDTRWNLLVAVLNLAMGYWCLWCGEWGWALVNAASFSYNLAIFRAYR